MIGGLGEFHYPVVRYGVCVARDILDLVLYVVEEAEVDGFFVKCEGCGQGPGFEQQEVTCPIRSYCVVVVCRWSVARDCDLLR